MCINWISSGFCEGSARPYSSQWWTAPSHQKKTPSDRNAFQNNFGEKDKHTRDQFEWSQHGIWSWSRIIAVWGIRSPRVNCNELRRINGQKWTKTKPNIQGLIPSPSIKTNLSAARSKSPKAFTAVTFGDGGTWKNSPGKKACLQILDW
jgi:hypothetical protein